MICKVSAIASHTRQDPGGGPSQPPLLLHSWAPRAEQRPAGLFSPLSLLSLARKDAKGDGCVAGVLASIPLWRQGLFLNLLRYFVQRLILQMAFGQVCL